MVTQEVCQETTNKATISPIFEPELAEIRAKLTLWDQQFGNTKVSQWLFDIAFHRLYQANGFEFANSRLTELRYALKRAEGPTSLSRIRRCKKRAKTELQAKVEEPEQPQGVAA